MPSPAPVETVLADSPVVLPQPAWSEWSREIREVLILGVPLAGSQVAQILLSATDTVMAGRFGQSDLAAIGVGGAVFYPLSLLGLGLLLAVSPTVSQLYGAGKHSEIGSKVHQGLWIALIMGLITMGIARFAEPVLRLMKVSDELIPTTMAYIRAISWGLPAMFGQVALRGLSEGVSRPRPLFVISLLSFPMNLLGNWIFMNGYFGMPRLGGVGCGVASAIVLWMNFAMMAAWVRYYDGYRPYHILDRWEWPHAKELWSLVRIGIPIGVGLFMECTLFAAGALLLGRFEPAVVAAHQASLNMASVTFMIPLGMSQAAAIRVGQAVGRRDPRGVRRAGLTGVGIAAAIMLLSGVCLALFPQAIAELYSKDAAVIAIMVRLLWYAAIFQIFDGVQVASMSALRGLKDTAVPAGITMLAYWGLGLPVAYWLCVVQEQKAEGVWIGFITALLVAATLLSLRFVRASKLFALEMLRRDASESEC